MNIRNATLSDLPEIVAIYNSTIESGTVTADTSPITVESRLEWFHQHTPDKRPLWIGETENKEIIGWLSFNDFYGRPAYHITAEISLYINENVRGKGYGNMLLKKAIETAPELGLENLLGFIFSSNESSIRLFKKHGFQTLGTIKNAANMNSHYSDLEILGLRLVQP